MVPESTSALSRIFRLLSRRRRLAPRSPDRYCRRLEVEPLEDRQLPSGYLLVGSLDNSSILRYSETTGAFVDQFDPHNLANLKSPNAGVFGSDGNLYVSSGVFQNNNHAVLQYNGTTGAFQAVYASQNLTGPRGLLFGPDCNLYVADASAKTGGPASVERFDGKTGAFLNTFNQPSSYGLATSPSYMVFGPDGNLYVAAAHEGVIYRYDGTTGAPLPAPGQPGAIFVPAGSGGLDAPAGIVFGADGNLYIASGNWFTSNNGPTFSGDFPPGAVMRFEGPSGLNPGAPEPALGQPGAIFIAGGSGGLANPNGILFGPHGDLYIASSVQSGTHGVLIAEPGTSEVLRYDGTTGAPLPAAGQPGAIFVPADSGGLKSPTFLTFTETNPTTLNYDGITTAIKASTLLAQTAISSGSGPLVAMVPTRPPSASIRFDPSELSTAFSRLQTPSPVPVATSSVVPLSPAPLPVQSLNNHLPHEASGLIQGLWHAQPAAVDQFLANLDVELSMPLVMNDLIVSPRS
jgi:sugar lactone lactonase YvrE